MNYYDPFILPFTFGVIILFSVIAYKYVRWYVLLHKKQKKLIKRGVFSLKSLNAVGEVFMESLLHRRIFQTNPVLGYMHASLAFGWFLLIAVGWVETTVYLSGEMVAPHVHVFFKFFDRGLPHSHTAIDFSFIMDLLLLIVLSGVGFALFKRLRSRVLGMKKTTKHTWGDKLALSSLWFIFPARLLAESTTSAIYDSGSFLTGSVGQLLSNMLSERGLLHLETFSWWFYSIVLGVFFVSMPFSRYMHIFTEIPLIFLRHYGLKSKEKPGSFDNFQIQACSRCGICIDPCQLQRDAGITNVQSVYFLRDRRYNKLTRQVADNCLMCGRCQNACPVDIDLNTLRLNSRAELRNVPSDGRYKYVNGIDRSEGEGKVGYFAGCMTLLTPRILQAMTTIFEVAKEDVWWADKDGGVCCGRPLKLSGEVDAARKMMNYNEELFIKHGITTLVTSCPICLKVFKEDYKLEGIEILHHSEYIARLIKGERISVKLGEELMAYHDPCELGRGCGIYEAPREVVSSVGKLVELTENKEKSLCCGSSLANLEITDEGQNKISKALVSNIELSGAESVVTSCPLCKKAIARNSSIPVYDLSEVVASSLRK